MDPKNSTPERVDPVRDAYKDFMKEKEMVVGLGICALLVALFAAYPILRRVYPVTAVPPKVCDFKGRIATITKNADGSYAGTIEAANNQPGSPFTVSAGIGAIKAGQFFNRCVFVSNE